MNIQETLPLIRQCPISKMTGTYTTIDGSEYEVFFADVRDGKRTISALVAKCTKGMKKSDTHFRITEQNISRNVLFGSWVKIEK